VKLCVTLAPSTVTVAEPEAVAVADVVIEAELSNAVADEFVVEAPCVMVRPAATPAYAASSLVV
jgi:hypothetical protein